MNKSSLKKGFTMVEMAIVIVIIGIIIAAIVGGKSIMDASNINAVVTSFTNYRNAYDKFVEDYHAVPGDMADAEDVFADADTHNGNGNSIVHKVDTDGSSEPFLFWQHLAAAGLIDGKFVVAGSHDGINIGVTVPQGPGSGSYMMAGHIGSGDDYEGVCDANGNVIMYERVQGSTTLQNLTAEDALAIDRKMDDGVPGFGKVCSADSSHCISGGVYDVSTKGLNCEMGYRLDDN